MGVSYIFTIMILQKQVYLKLSVIQHHWLLNKSCRDEDYLANIKTTRSDKKVTTKTFSPNYFLKFFVYENEMASINLQKGDKLKLSTDAKEFLQQL